MHYFSPYIAALKRQCMRGVVLLVAFLALTFVAAYAAVDVSDDIRDGRIISQSPQQRRSVAYWWVVV